MVKITFVSLNKDFHNIIFKKLNLNEQHKYYENTEWIDIPINEIIRD